jgi:hypothetical protein
MRGSWVWTTKVRFFDQAFMRMERGRVARPAAIHRSGQGASMPLSGARVWRGKGFSHQGKRPTRPFQLTRLTTTWASRRRAMASARPRTWFPMPARPSETAQMVSGGWVLGKRDIQQRQGRADRDPRSLHWNSKPLRRRGV